jgi:hypothetical protein
MEFKLATLRTVIEQLRGVVSEDNYYILHALHCHAQTYREIAAELGVDAHAVRQRHVGLLVKVRQCVAAFLGPTDHEYQ